LGKVSQMQKGHTLYAVKFIEKSKLKRNKEFLTMNEAFFK